MGTVLFLLPSAGCCGTGFLSWRLQNGDPFFALLSHKIHVTLANGRVAFFTHT